jgi:hypothetical protein
MLSESCDSTIEKLNCTFCTTCNKIYSTRCAYRQGRCPHHPNELSRLLTWIKQEINNIAKFKRSLNWRDK